MTRRRRRGRKIRKQSSPIRIIRAKQSTIPHNDQQVLGSADCHVEAFGVIAEPEFELAIVREVHLPRPHKR